MENQGLTSAPEATEEQFDNAEVVETTQETTTEAGTAGEEKREETVAEEVQDEAGQADPKPEVTEAEQEVKAETADPEEKEAVNPYAGKSQEELIGELERMIAEKPVQTLRPEIEALKIAFYKEGRALIEAQREAFVVNGGDPEEFKPEENPNEAKFKEQLNLYREKRNEYLQQSEKEKENAYEKKLQIIEELKELVSGNETLGNTFQMFRDLQQRWKDAGIVPQEKLKDLWDTYHHHVENFYNYIKINKELRDLDLKKNYETKTELAEEAERLMLEPSAVEAFHKLQKLHEDWRETGPVAAEYKDALWERFKAASTQINKRHQEYFEGIKAEQKQNLALKTELCEKVEELAEKGIATRKEWDEASEQIIQIQQVWRTIGFAPKKDNTTIYERFRAACDKFFEAKREFYKEVKSELEDNLQAKVDLCVQAEALQESEEWKETTDLLIGLQKKWKEVGPIARKHSEKVWSRFKAACDHFFERKSKHFGAKDEQYTENLTKKQQLIEELRGVVEAYKTKKEALTFDTIKEYQKQWAEIGFVPIKQKAAIQKEYRKVVDELFALLREDERSRHMKNFKSKLKEGGGKNMRNERDRLYNKVRQIEGDIQVLENNIGFFSKSKNAEGFVKEVEQKIAKAKAEMAMLIEKINLIDNPHLAENTAAEPQEQAKVSEKEEAPVVETKPDETDPVKEEIPVPASETPEEQTPETADQAKNEAPVEEQPESVAVEQPAQETEKEPTENEG